MQQGVRPTLSSRLRIVASFWKVWERCKFPANLCELYSGMPGQATETDLLQLKERGVSSNVLTKRTVKTHYTVMHRQMRR